MLVCDAVVVVRLVCGTFTISVARMSGVCDVRGCSQTGTKLQLRLCGV